MAAETANGRNGVPAKSFGARLEAQEWRRASPPRPGLRSPPRKRWDAARAPAVGTASGSHPRPACCEPSSVARMRTSESLSAEQRRQEGADRLRQGLQRLDGRRAQAGILRAKIGQAAPDAGLVADAHERGHDRFPHARNLLDAERRRQRRHRLAHDRRARARRSIESRRRRCANRRCATRGSRQAR